MNQCMLWNERARFDAWQEFHRENPDIFRLFCTFAEEARRAGRKAIGARMIGERIRWYTTVETHDPDYKVNNNHWPYYARLLYGLDPEAYDGFFEFRDSQFDSTIEEILEAHSAS